MDLEEKVEEILGFKMTVMRPPFGRYNDTVLDVIRTELNYSVIMWNIDTNDWDNLSNTDLSFQAYLDAMEYDTRLNSSFIALHHDFAEGSGILASRAIDYVLEKGFNFVTISECIGKSSDSNSANSIQFLSIPILFLLYFVIVLSM